MAGKRETPRQKMIGMMYLVLLAMLALNVSRDIINAFVSLNDKIEDQNQTFELSNSRSASDLESAFYTTVSESGYESVDPAEAYARALVDNKRSVIKLYRLLQVAENVDSLALQASDYVMETASDMLNEGQSGKWVVRDDRGHLKIVNLNDPDEPYNKKDDYDTPTRLMVDEGGAKQLLKRIERYKYDLVKQIASVPIDGKVLEYDPPALTLENAEDMSFVDRLEESFPDSVSSRHKKAIHEVYRILSFPEKAKSHGDWVNWDQAKFDHAPMVAAAALMTSIKGQILQAQGVVLNFIAAENDVPPFKFDRIEPKAFAETAYINTGDSLTLEVLIAAYHSKAITDMRVVVDPEDETAGPDDMTFLKGTNKLVLGKNLGGAIGDHYVKGQIAVEENGSTVWKDFDFSYKVGAPSTSIGNAEMNVVYVGYDNQISATASGYTDVSASCSGCSRWTKNGDAYIARVSSGTNRIQVVLTGKDKTGETVTIGNQEFRVLPMPRPRIVIPGIDPYKHTISATVLSNSVFTAQFTASTLTIPVGLTTGSIMIQQGEVQKTYQLVNNALPADARNIIRNLRPGSTVVLNGKARVGSSIINLDPKVFQIR